MLVRMWLLFEKLPDGVLAAEEDAAAIDIPAGLTYQQSVQIQKRITHEICEVVVTTYITKSHVSSFIS